jgi:hypothetical protein
LNTAKCLAEVIIVTNGEDGWIDLSCASFLPEVVPHIATLKTVSARSAFEELQPQSPLWWKHLAFNVEISCFLAKPCEGTDRRSIVSIGDSNNERVALFGVTEHQECWAKSVKLLEQPSMEELVEQHKMLYDQLAALMAYEGCLDLGPPEESDLDDNLMHQDDQNLDVLMQ